MSLSELRKLEGRYLMPTYARLPVEFVRGQGTKLYDSEGNEYLDFLAGISVSSLGHCHPAVVQAISEQAGRLMHVTNLFYTEPAMRLAEKLSESSLGGKVFFSNSGTEANEAAIKLARRAKPRGEIVVVERAFHGRTYGALSATPQIGKQEPFAPLVPGFKCVEAKPEQLAAAVGPQTAAVLLEPIQGETGIHVLSDELLATAREVCDRHGVALIFDEVQCGIGRTGSLWAYQQTGVVPDALTTAKALGGGMPIGALVTGPRLADTFQPGDHGSTFAGGSVVAAAALQVLKHVDDPGFLQNIKDLGEKLMTAIATLPSVVSVRGRGLMVGFDTELDAPELVRIALLEQRLVINATGPNTIRLLPPLNVSAEEISEAVGRLTKLLQQ